MAKAKTLRNYVTPAEIEAIEGSSYSGMSLELIARAEALIDRFCGYHIAAYASEEIGTAAAGGTTSLTLSARHANSITSDDFYKGANVEIVAGVGEGQVTIVTASTAAGVLTIDELSTAVDDTSVYKIFQVGKFPRNKDRVHHNQDGSDRYLVTIPRKLKEAVAAQVAFMSSKGDAFFATDSSAMSSERFGDYGYTRGGKNGEQVEAALISPRAQTMLLGSGLVQRVGQITG